MRLIGCIGESFYPSFWADLIIGALGAFLGIIGAYWLYALSLRRQKEDQLKYFVSLLESIIPSALRQAQFCKVHASDILKQPYENLLLKIEPNRDTKRLADKVDQEKVYHAYLWKYKRSNKTYLEFRNLYARVDYLDSLITDLITTNERILTAVWNRKKEYQVTFNRALNIIQTIILNKEIQMNQQGYVAYIQSLIKQFSGKKSYEENIAESFNEVVNPFSEYTKTNAKQHPKITELLFLLDDLYRQFIGIEISVHHNAQQYEWYAEKLKTVAEELAETSNQLQKDFSTS